ncbi:MAG: NCS2 family permease [Bacteroidaceae bacterium]|nr:NCS2 family permease [Bacteroidaceae bacterium]
MKMNGILGFDSATMSLKKEMVGGATTFLTMAYILAVNPLILADAGMDQGAVFTATALSSIIATLLMAFLAKLPFALAPAMGLNAFFAYTVVVGMGQTWQFALTAVLIEGLLFILLTLTGLRNLIVMSIPLEMRRAISVGIGLFIAYIGLSNANIITSGNGTLLALGNFTSPSVLLSLAGIVLCAVLLVRRVTGALMIGILVISLAGIPLGVTHLNGIVNTPPSLAPTFFKFEWSSILSGNMFISVFTLLFFDMFDTIGTLIGVSSQAGMLDKDGNVPRMKQAFLADAVGTTVGAVLGTSTVSSFVESASGVNAGGKSGLTSVFTALCFLLAMFFAPLFLAIPSEATAPVLVIVGVMMMAEAGKIDYGHYLTSIPAFVCMIMMPLSGSISDGLMMGVIAYVLIHIFSGKWRNVNIGAYILAALFILKYAFL